MSEQLSILERIRRKTGLLVGLVGVALLIFILESLLGSGSSLFGSDDRFVGHINGKAIERNDFLNRLDMQINQFKQQRGQDADDQVRGQLMDNLWQQYVVEFAIRPAYESAGIMVGENELYQHVVMNPDQTILQNLTDPNTGRINQQFSKADGTLDLIKWKQAVQSVTGESEMAVKQMEDQVKNTLIFSKYKTLLSKSMYITQAEATLSNAYTNADLDFEYVFKSYATIPDNTVKITDEDLETYYKAHQYEFKNTEDVRKVEYVTFDVLPSDSDINAVGRDAQRCAKAFEGKTTAEDSLFMQQESENGDVVIQNLTRKTMIIRDSSVYTAARGTVFGPYNEGAYYKIYKLQNTESIADSARVRHILIGTTDPQSRQATRTKERAKAIADSLLVLIQKKSVSFDSLVVQMSDDPGSKKINPEAKVFALGDYGWFTESTGFVDAFKYTGLKGTAGDIKVVETQFGFHIIEVLNVSSGKHKTYTIAQIFKPIRASEQTNQKIYAKAFQFSSENNTSEKFDQAVDKQKLTKRMSDNLKETDRQLQGGLGNVRELIHWAFSAKTGDIAYFKTDDRHIVVKLAAIKNPGYLALEVVKNDIRTKVLNEKKAVQLMAEFKASGNTLNAIASKCNISIKTERNVKSGLPAFGEMGQDLYFMGTLSGIKPNVCSGAISGEQGVFALNVIKRQLIAAPANIREEQRRLESELAGRSDFSSFNALKELADIESRLGKLD
jgi:peptidyl-prolyl cis-trans isomerase D